MCGLRTTATAVAGLVGLPAAFGSARPQRADEPTLFLVSPNDRHGDQPPVPFTVAGGSVRGRYPVAVKQFRLRTTSPVTVPARGRTALTGSLPVTMPEEATVKCADTRFTIVLSGTGTKAPR